MPCNFSMIFMEYLRILGTENTAGGQAPGHEGPGRAPCLVGPLVLLRPQLQLYIFVFGEKKSGRKIHRVLRYGAAAKP